MKWNEIIFLFLCFVPFPWKAFKQQLFHDRPFHYLDRGPKRPVLDPERPTKDGG